MRATSPALSGAASWTSATPPGMSTADGQCYRPDQRPVTDPATGQVTGVITLPDLLHARLHDLTEENHRERTDHQP